MDRNPRNSKRRKRRRAGGAVHDTDDSNAREPSLKRSRSVFDRLGPVRNEADDQIQAENNNSYRGRSASNRLSPRRNEGEDRRPAENNNSYRGRSASNRLSPRRNEGEDRRPAENNNSYRGRSASNQLSPRRNEGEDRRPAENNNSYRGRSASNRLSPRRNEGEDRRSAENNDSYRGRSASNQQGSQRYQDDRRPAENNNSYRERRVFNRLGPERNEGEYYRRTEDSHDENSMVSQQNPRRNEQDERRHAEDNDDNEYDHSQLNQHVNQVLSAVLKESPDESALLLSSLDLSNIVSFVLESDIENLYSLIEVLAKCCQSSNSDFKSKILGNLLSCKFFVHPKLHHVMLKVISDNEGVSHVSDLVNVFSIVQQIMIHRPSDMEHVQVILVLLDGIMVRVADYDMQDVAELHRLHTSLTQSESVYKRHMEELLVRAHHRELTERLAEDKPLLCANDVLDATDRERYIPTNYITATYKTLHEYLQVHFKLLHEDFLQPLRKGLEHYMEHCRDSSMQSRFRDYDIKVYEGVKVVSKKYHSNDGVLFTVQVQDHNLNRNARRMIYGSLMCLVDSDLSRVIFTTLAGKEDTKAGLLDLCLESDDDADMEHLFDRTFVMIESTAFYRAYKFVLDGLRRLHSIHPDHLSGMMRYFAFSLLEVDQPRYLRNKPDLEYDFSCLVKKPHSSSLVKFNDFLRGLKPSQKMKCFLAVSSTWPSHSEVGLNESQYAALKTALTHEISIIQGPPGTGKSYLGTKIVNLLLQNRQAWGEKRPGPILVICYTNHALDQFLEEILKAQEVFLLPANFLVRVGSRSESEKLMRWNLKEVRKQFGLLEAYHKARFEVKGTAESLRKLQFYLRETVSGILRVEFVSEEYDQDMHCRLSRPLNANDSLEWLGLNDDRFVSEVSKCDKSGGAPAPKQRDIGDSVEDMIKNHSRRLDVDEDFDDAQEEVEFGSRQAYNFNNEFPHPDMHAAKRASSTAKYLLKAMHDPSCLPREFNKFSCYIENWKQYITSLVIYQTELQTRIKEQEEVFKRALRVFRVQRAAQERTILRNTWIIGMTTTAAATYQKVLDVVAPKIVVVEEAAEILEGHVVTSISKHCEQLIMIGDHKQLKPKANTYALECAPHNLNVSLFERLLKKGLSVDRLTVQHRMRPEIRELLVPEIYEDLEDHESVTCMENIKGMKHNLYFIDHNAPEDMEETSSHSNKYEAEYLKALAQYLLKQGHSAEDITILAPYRGQTRLIRDLLGEDPSMEKLRVTAVDNYQGEESKIILLSLVRSNKDKRIGFMNEETRVCVSLSRAKQGLYVIGNSKMFASKSKVWKAILVKMKARQEIGQSLWLQCNNHEKPIETEIKKVEDFKLVSHGGCSQLCGARLNCGHACPANCHSAQQLDHDTMPCLKPCYKSCPNGHKCRKQCYERCRCTVLMEKIIPSCGHKQMVECATHPVNYECKEKCEQKLECGHPCRRYCGNPCTILCSAGVQITLPCGHQMEVECYKEASSKQIVCGEVCSSVLQCGHPCKGTCGQCFQGRLHVPCKSRCGRSLVCGHMCSSKCTNCPPCEKACVRKCKHSRCQRRCWEDCVPCREPCDWQCEHYVCGQECGELCDRERCDHPCKKTLCCGHPCVGLCSEPCPRLCRICDKAELCEIFFGDEEDEDARFIQLDCQHVFEVNGIDQWMDQVQDSDNSIQPKSCPKCKRPVYAVLRYGNLIKQIYADIDVVKMKIAGEMNSSKEEVRGIAGELQQYVEESFIKNLKRNREDILHVAKVLLALFKQLDEIGRVYVRSTLHKEFEVLMPTKSQYRKRLQEISRRQMIGEQEQEEFIAEMGRFRLMVHFWVMIENQSIIQHEKKQREMKADHCDEAELQPFDVEAEITKIQELFKRGHKLSEEDTHYIKGVLKKSTEISKIPGVSDEDRMMIVNAMGYKKGHWYKCPKGHVYIITECGGAMERSKCPECGAAIGGSQHRLTDGNTVATEMDGATHAAWSDAANNMRNFEMDDF